MSVNVIDKYKSKKKKDLVEYSKILESIITLETNTLWSNKQTFSALCKEIVEYYVETYYFENNKNRNNPIEYSNDNINFVLLSIIEYYKSIFKPDMIKDNKNETFLLAVIICSASYVDIASNVIDGSYVDVKENIKILLNHLKKTNLLKIYDKDKVTLNSLFKDIKKNVSEEERFFNYFVSDCYSNVYKCINKEESLYEVKFNYVVQGLDGYDKEMVKKIEKDFSDKYLLVSYELLVVLLLKEYIMNKDVNNYLINVSESLLNKENSFKVIDNEMIKKNINLLIPFDLYFSFKNKVNKLVESGFKVMYKYDGEDISLLRDVYKCSIIVKKELLENNKDGVFELRSHDIKFIVLENGIEITDNVICNKEEE
ncbi:MAG: hypothetical protein RR478_03890 [Bacilli bacterium]